MTRTYLPAFGLPALGATLLAMAFLVSPSARAAPPSAPRVAVVDMWKLIREHKRFTQLTDRFKVAEQKASKYAEEERGQLQDLKTQIAMMVAHVPERKKLEHELVVRGSLLEVEIKWRLQEAQAEFLRDLQALYTSIQHRIGRYAQEHVIGLVLHKASAELEASDLNDLAAKVHLRSVLHAGADMDVTEEIARLLDDK